MSFRTRLWKRLSGQLPEVLDAKQCEVRLVAREREQERPFIGIEAGLQFGDHAPSRNGGNSTSWIAQLTQDYIESVETSTHARGKTR